MPNTKLSYITKSDISDLREKLQIGQRIITYKVPWSRGQGKHSTDEEERKVRHGQIVAKYEHYFLVLFDSGIRECFQYTDLLMGDVQVEGDDDFEIERKSLYLLTL